VRLGHIAFRGKSKNQKRIATGNDVPIELRLALGSLLSMAENGSFVSGCASSECPQVDRLRAPEVPGFVVKSTKTTDWL
jgi:hypothetical protein